MEIGVFEEMPELQPFAGVSDLDVTIDRQSGQAVTAGAVLHFGRFGFVFVLAENPRKTGWHPRSGSNRIVLSKI